MPEYMTKCEPVDKKPYIVYTPDKNIVYSGDSDSDIPGGGGGGSSTHKVYISDSQTLNAPDAAVTDSNENTVATDTETVSITTPEGPREVTFITFTAVDGGVYEVSANNGNITQSQLFKFPDPNSTYWGGQLLVNGKVSITAPNFDIMVMVSIAR